MRRRDTHQWVQDRLADEAGGERSSLSRRRMDRHIANCDRCAAELERQQLVKHALARVAEEAIPGVEPPDDLLATLLDQAQESGLRQRVAVPARGAVSGARPGLSVLFGLGIVAAIAGAAWAGWQLGRKFRER